jgi:hypothetical protein
MPIYTNFYGKRMLRDMLALTNDLLPSVACLKKKMKTVEPYITRMHERFMKLYTYSLAVFA